MAIKEPRLNINGELVEFRDIKKIIEVLTKKERDKIEAIKKDIVSIDEQKITAKKFQNLANKLRESAVKLTTQDINVESVFKQMIPSPIGMDVGSFVKYLDVKVKPEADVQPTTISVQPTQIAVAERWQSKTFPSKVSSVTEPSSSTTTTLFKAGDFKVLVQNNAVTMTQDFNSKVGSVVAINSSNKFSPGKFYINNKVIELQTGNNLNDICNKINSLDIGIKATVEDNPDPNGSQYKLFLRSEKIGAENNFQIDDPDGVFANLNKNGDDWFFDKHNEYKTVSLKPGDTLETIAYKINKFDKETNLRAEVFQLSHGQYSLILKSLSPGLENAFKIIDDTITLTGSNNSNIFGSIFNKDVAVSSGKPASVTTAQDAKLLVDGFEMQGPTNIFEIYPGIEVTLKSTNASGMTFEIKNDINGILSKVIDLGDKYSLLKQMYVDTIPIDRKGEKSQFEQTYTIKKAFEDLDNFITSLENLDIGLSKGKLELDKKDGDKTIKHEYEDMIIIDKMKLITAIEEKPQKVMQAFDMSYDSSSKNFIKPIIPTKIGINNQSLGSTRIDLNLKVDLNKTNVKSYSSIVLSDVNNIFDPSGLDKNKFKSGTFWINGSAVTLTSSMSLSQVRNAINSVSNMSRISASISTNSNGSYISFTQYSGGFKASDDNQKFQEINIFDPNNILQRVFSPKTDTSDFDVSSTSVASNYITPGQNLKINGFDIEMPTSKTLADLVEAINNMEYKTGVNSESIYNTTTGKFYIRFNNRKLSDISFDNSANALTTITLPSIESQQAGQYFFDTSNALNSKVEINDSSTNKNCILVMNGSDLKSGGKIKIMNNDNSSLKVDGVEILFIGEGIDETKMTISQGLGSAIVESLDKLLKLQQGYKGSTSGLIELDENIRRRKEDMNKTLENLEKRLKQQEKQITAKWAKVHSYFDAQNAYDDLVTQLYKNKSDD